MACSAPAAGGRDPLSTDAQPSQLRELFLRYDMQPITSVNIKISHLTAARSSHARVSPWLSSQRAHFAESDSSFTERDSSYFALTESVAASPRAGDTRITCIVERVRHRLDWDQPRELVVHVGRGGGGSVLASARLARAVVALARVSQR